MAVIREFRLSLKRIGPRGVGWLGVSLTALLALVLSPPLLAGNGGGHGGSGHAGGHFGSGGHFGGGGSSGHSFGHSVGHSLSHIFGHHATGRDGGLKNSGGGRGGIRAGVAPAAVLHSRPGHRMFHRNRVFGSSYCDSLRFSWRNFFFPGQFDCFDNTFAFGPFFYGGSLSTYFWSDSLTNTEDFAGPFELADSESNTLSASSQKRGPAAPSLSNISEPVTLLQLLDGSMYGLSRYWLEGTNLHYVTNYGGENSVPLVQIDFARTAEINAERGTQLDLTRNLLGP